MLYSDTLKIFHHIPIDLKPNGTKTMLFYHFSINLELNGIKTMLFYHFPINLEPIGISLGLRLIGKW